ncbi:Structural maintenance of chromosomes 5 [Carabus blaptoides fortunei]
MSKPGVIKKINIKNFVTYSDVEIHPIPNLNIVIGPNGTGKSTIVAAIILGLGGTPKTIGRGTKISEYVRHNCSEARIDIELEAPISNKASSSLSSYTVTRVFNINNQNQWYLNGKHVSENEVKQAMNQLNIQVTNLCQFLPQDRVQDFAKMNKRELLVNTQWAKQLTKDIDLLNKKCDQAEADIARLEGKVKNLNEKKKIMQQVDGVKRKLSWQNYTRLLEEEKSVTADRDDAQKVLDEYRNKLQPLETQITQFKKKTSVLQHKLLEVRNHFSKQENKVKDYLDKSKDMESSHKQIHIEMKTKLQALAEYQKEIDVMKVKIDKLVNDETSLIAQYGEEDDVNTKANKFLQASKQYERKSEDINRQRASSNNMLRRLMDQSKVLETRLQESENIKDQRLQILKRKDADAYNAVLWLRENRQQFRGNVYEPMMLELNVLDPVHSKYLENIVPMRDRVAFTCEYRDDMNRLLQCVRDELRLNINVVHSGSEHPSLTAYRPNVPIEQMRAYGFFAYCNTLISGPEPLVKYLCRMYSIHNIPIGDQSTYNQAARVPNQIRLFFSDAHRFAVSVSRYTGDKSTRISDVHSDGTFSVCIDYNRINAMKRELAELEEKQTQCRTSVDELASEKQTYDNKCSELLQQRQQTLHNGEQVRTIRNRLAAARRTLNDYMQDHQTPEQIRKDAGVRMKQLVLSAIKLQGALASAIEELSTALENEERLALELSTGHECIAQLENETEGMRTNINEALQIYERIDTVHRRAVQETREALHAARKLSGGAKPGQQAFTKYQEEYDRLPSDLSALQDQINELQTRLECILTADDGELAAYEKNQQTLTQCREELTSKEAEMEMARTTLTSRHTDWMGAVQTIVGQINTRFGEYFQTLGCAGEVQISMDNGVDEYEAYGLSIRVTYRAEEPLQELNSHVQSGGERAVATAIFMLSLQQLTAAPFRCVDEINQGMDPQNERRIFNILVHATAGTGDTEQSNGGSSQYFLITPKLVNGLRFGDGMAVHVSQKRKYMFVNK